MCVLGCIRHSGASPLLLADFVKDHPSPWVDLLGPGDIQSTCIEVSSLAYAPNACF